MSDVLFVYGSLRSGCDNPFARRLHAEADLIGPSIMRGSIFRVGRYLGYKPEPDGAVQGELWSLRTPEKTLPVLDDYEGPAYSRELREDVWIYVYSGAVDPEKRIG